MIPHRRRQVVLRFVLVASLELVAVFAGCGSPRNYVPCEKRSSCQDASTNFDGPAGFGGWGGSSFGVGGNPTGVGGNGDSAGAIGGAGGLGRSVHGSGGGGQVGSGGTSTMGTGGTSATGSGGTSTPGGGGASPGKLVLGATCGGHLDCDSGHCVDGVCCNRACGGACEACNVSGNLGVGTCTFVSGATKPGHPPCAGTGACAGSCQGASADCVFPRQETTCRPATCNNGSAMAAASCDGTGNCLMSAMTACAPFSCGALSCLVKCSQSADCITGNYCSNQSCFQKKGIGSVCGTFDECTSAICGGRCCSSPCTCPQPSAQNLFKNPGFDSDLSGWEMFTGTSTGVQWSSDDVDGCPYSGSVKVHAAQGNPAQCIAITPGMYNFGGWFKNTDGSYFSCAFVPYPGNGCTGDAQIIGPEHIDGNETVWTFKSGAFLFPAGSTSLLIRCDASPNTFMDKLFFSKGGY